MKEDRWAAYLRTSSMDQHPENQRQDIVRYLERIGAHADYFEEKESTRKTRPIKQQLLKEIREGKYDGIIVWQLSRWARSMSELIPELEMFINQNIKFVSIKDLGEVDGANPGSKLLVHVIGAFSEFEREIIRQRTIAGLERAKSQGKKLGRPKGSKDKKKRKKSGYYLRYQD